MADHPLITDYLTPLPPFMAGSNALDKAISDVWKKRQDDEQLRIAAAQQEALQAYQQGMVGVGQLGATESRRHNRATEAHSFGTLQRDIANDQAKYLADIATAYNDRKNGLGDALSVGAGLLGLPALAMAAPVAEGQGGGDAGGAYYDLRAHGPAEPGAQPSPQQAQAQAPVDTAAAPPSTNALPQAAPGVIAQGPAAPVQGAAPAPPQAELNAPQAPAPPQPAGDPNAPPATAPMPPQQAAPPAAAPQQAAPGGQVRSDIHIQPKPPSQLGVEQPIAPGTPAELPRMPYANDPTKHPTALEANPNWEGQAPTQFPGGVAQPHGTPETGPLGVAPGGIDQATQRQWFINRGVAGRAVMPNGQQMMSADQQRVNQSLQMLNGYARDGVEREFARVAIENGTAAAAVMPADKAYNEAVKQFNHSVDLYNKNVRSTEIAGAQAGRFQAGQERQMGESWLSDLEKLYADRGIPKMLARYKAAKDLRSILANADPNSAEWQQTVRGFLESMENRGAVTDEDIKATSGESNSAILERVMGKIQVWLTGVPGPQRENIKEAIARMIPIMEDQAAEEFEVLSRYIAGAPNAWYEDRGRRRNEAMFGTYGWFPGGSKAERAGKFRGPAAVKPPKAGGQPQKRPGSTGPSAPPGGAPSIPGYNYTPPKGKP